MFLSIFLNPAKTAIEPQVGRLQKLCWFCSLVWAGFKEIHWLRWVSDGQERQIYFNKIPHKVVELLKNLKFRIELPSLCWCISILHYRKKKKKKKGYMTATKVYLQSKQSLLLSNIRVLWVPWSQLQPEILEYTVDISVFLILHLYRVGTVLAAGQQGSWWRWG